MYGVVLEPVGEDSYSLDEQATAALRESLRLKRRADAVPVATWWAQERDRITDGALPDAVREMYRSSTSFAGYGRSFREFWQLPESFDFPAPPSNLGSGEED
jgi:hypothetical protein